MGGDPLIGQALGSYVIRQKVGQGGMGAIYLALHPVIERRAAVKVLLPELSNDRATLERFFVEARTTARLRHPAMVDVYDCGTLPDGRGFIVMDFLEGESLEERLQRVGRLPVDEALRIARQVAVGMSVAHAEGIVHRDLKPDNLFLVPRSFRGGEGEGEGEGEGGQGDELAREQVKILDFGIAKLLRADEADVRHTRTGALLGTPLYMAPEQCRGAGAIDHRADVYALGCVLYAMLTGRPPFVHDGIGEVMVAHLHDPPPPLAAAGVQVPAPVEAVLRRALAKAPADRQASMMQLARELGALLATPADGGAMAALRAAETLVEAPAASGAAAWTSAGGGPVAGAGRAAASAAPGAAASASPGGGAGAPAAGIPTLEAAAPAVAVTRPPPGRRFGARAVWALGLGAGVALGALGLLALAGRPDGTPGVGPPAGGAPAAGARGPGAGRKAAARGEGAPARPSTAAPASVSAAPTAAAPDAAPEPGEDPAAPAPGAAAEAPAAPAPGVPAGAAAGAAEAPAAEPGRADEPASDPPPRAEAPAAEPPGRAEAPAAEPPGRADEPGSDPPPRAPAPVRRRAPRPAPPADDGAPAGAPPAEDPSAPVYRGTRLKLRTKPLE
jgi:serine/threonine-protein kinase